jgi:hypothetical protein
MNFSARGGATSDMKRWHLFASFCAALALLAGCVTLDEKQRVWIFQPSDRTWSGGAAAAKGRDAVWIPLNENSKVSGDDRLHGLWLPAEPPQAGKPA